jgi:hypothetical protein
MGAAPGGSNDRLPSEAEVKAAFLYHFTRLVEWPEPPTDAPFVIAVMNADRFGTVLEDVLGKRAPDRQSFEVRKQRHPPGAGRPLPQVLFLGARTSREARPALAAVQDAPVLTVGDYEGFASDGGMIGFRLTDDGRVSFDINVAAAEQAGLKVSSQLLKLARIVEARR